MPVNFKIFNPCLMYVYIFFISVSVMPLEGVWGHDSFFKCLVLNIKINKYYESVKIILL